MSTELALRELNIQTLVRMENSAMQIGVPEPVAARVAVRIEDLGVHPDGNRCLGLDVDFVGELPGALLPTTGCYVFADDRGTENDLVNAVSVKVVDVFYRHLRNAPMLENFMRHVRAGETEFVAEDL